MTLDDLNNFVGVSTPFILLAWFYYSQKQQLSKSYFNEVDGLYAGFTNPLHQAPDGLNLYGGVIMNIRDTDDKGFFKGDFDYAESYMAPALGGMSRHMLTRSINTFTGKLEFKVYRDRERHTFKPGENRIYKGKLYLVDRLDFSFEDYKIEDYLIAEYDVKHYREMQTFEFNLAKVHRGDQVGLPNRFRLYKKMGASFEPFRNVKEIVFGGKTHSDA